MKAYLPYVLLPLAIVTAPWAAQWLGPTATSHASLRIDTQSINAFKGMKLKENPSLETASIKTGVFSSNKGR